MTKLAVRKRNYRVDRPEAWKILASFDPRDIEPMSTIPDELRAHYKAGRGRRGYIGYVSFRDLPTPFAIAAYALTKGQVAKVTVNQWGHVVGYWLPETAESR